MMAALLTSTSSFPCRSRTAAAASSALVGAVAGRRGGGGPHAPAPRAGGAVADAGGVGEVRAGRRDSDRAGRRRRRLGVAGRQHDVVTGGGQLAADLEPDAAAGAGDQRDGSHREPTGGRTDESTPSMMSGPRMPGPRM